MSSTKTLKQPKPSDAAQPDAPSIVRSVFDRHLIVEAGAGTGKTWLLIERMVALLREQRASIDRIVAITFTEKAAAEIRLRLRKRLHEEWHAADAQGRLRWARALEDLDKAPINTIHGFAASLVKEYPVEARIDPGAAVEDEARSLVRFERTWNAWIREELSRDDAVWREVLTEHTLSSVKELARVMMRNREIVLREDLSTGDPARALREQVAALQEAATALRVALESCHDIKDPMLTGAEPMLEWVDQCAARTGDHDALTAWCVEPPRFQKTRARTWKNRWESEEAFQAGREAFNGLVDYIRDTAACVKDMAVHERTVKAINKVRGFLRRIEQSKRADGVLDFDDLLTNARDLLRDHPQVRKRVQEQYRYLLVDEFQDTDPVQAELVMWLGEAKPLATDWREVALEPGKLFLVGDPKQSIYGWRKASLSIYREVTELALRQNGLFLTLERNYRSDERALHVVNDVFSRLMAEETPFQPKYRVLIPERLVEGGAPRVEILLTAPESDDDEWSAGQRRRAEASALAQRIRELVDRGLPDGRPVAYGDIAMLFRYLSDVGLYEEALRLAGIPYVVASGRNYYQRPEITDLLNLFRCIDNPEDAVSFVGVLRSPIVGLSDADISALFQALSQHGGRPDGAAVRFDRPIPEAGLDAVTGPGRAAFERACELLRGLSARRHTMKVSELIERIFEDTSWLVVLSAMPGGEQQIANLRKLLKMAARREEDGALTVKRWVGLLSELLQMHDAEGDSPLAEESADAVRLMTVHKSKGLEFGVVMLLDTGRDLSKRGRGGDLSADERAGVWGCSVSGLRTISWRCGLADALVRRTEAEELRLGYVALTRAKECVIVSGVAPAGRGDEDDAPARKASGRVSGSGYSLLQWIGQAMGLSWSETAAGVWERDKARVNIVHCDHPEERRHARRVTLKALLKHEPSADWAAYADETRRLRAAYDAAFDIRNSRIAQVTALATDQVASGKLQGTNRGGSRGGAEASLLDDWRARELGRRTGILVHEALERLSFKPRAASTGGAASVSTNASAVPASVSAAAEPWLTWLRRRVRAEADLSPDDQHRLLDESQAIIEQLLKSSFIERLSKADRVEREVPVLFRDDSGLVRDGRLDLMFEERGVLYLVDYKTDRHIQDDLSSYSKQLQSYKEAVEALWRRPVKTALYYVRHDRWIDVE